MDSVLQVRAEATAPVASARPHGTAQLKPDQQQPQLPLHFQELIGHAREQHRSSDGVSQPQQQPAELHALTQRLAEAEQRASAAELATAAVQRAHTEAVEKSTRLQARHFARLPPSASSSKLTRR